MNSRLSKKQFTSVVFVTFVSIMLLQNGPLNNIPIVLLFVPVFLGKLSISMHMGKVEKILALYGIYLITITVINLPKNTLFSYTVNIIIQYLIIYLSMKVIVPQVDEGLLLYKLRNFGILLSILCILEAVMKNHFLAGLLGKSVTTNARVVSIFNHPIVCGSFLLITFCLILLLPFRKSDYKVSSLVVCLAAIILTQSRSVWFGTLIVIFLSILKFYKNKVNKKVIKYFFLFIVLLIFASLLMKRNFVVVVFEYIQDRFQGMLEAGEGKIVRLEILDDSIEYWENNLSILFWGRGKNYGLMYLEKHPITKFGSFVWTAAIDNQYITIVFETGLIGLALVGSGLLYLTNQLIKSRPNERLVLSSSLALLGSSVVLFFYEGFNYPVLVMIFEFLIFVQDKNTRRKCDE